MNATATIRLVMAHEFEAHDGACGACPKKNLRWVFQLSDGSMVGSECAKRLLGYKPSRLDYGWVERYRPVAHYTEGAAHWVLWTQKSAEHGIGTRETRDGVLMGTGGNRTADWQKRGWI
jgi:hypothetical protein